MSLAGSLGAAAHPASRAVDRAQARLAALAAATPRAIQPLRATYEQARASLLASVVASFPPPGEASRALTRLADALLGPLFAAICQGPEPVALFAVGGYGRAELAPGSDLDLCVLYLDDNEAAREAAERAAAELFRTLWDLGLTIGHAVRPVGDLERLLKTDVPSASALLDARRLAGEPNVAEALAECTRALLATGGVDLLAAKLAELSGLHARHGASPSLSEPHLKAGAGGLRDHELCALAACVGDPRIGIPWLEADERRALEVERVRLGDWRFALHLVEGRRQDRLHFEQQAGMLGVLQSGRKAEVDAEPAAAPAESAGDGDADAGSDLSARLAAIAPASPAAVRDAMRWHARESGRLVRAVRLIREAVEERQLSPALTLVGRPPRPGDRLLERAGALELARQDALAGAPTESLLEPFLLAQEQKLALRPTLEEAVRRERTRLDQGDWEAPAVGALFLRLLAGQSGVAAALDAMHRAGLLGEVLPEFGALEGLHLGDPYHAYAVDAHSLGCVAQLEAFAASPAREDQVRAEVLGRLPALEVLRLAALCHDMGKAKGGDHVRAGADMVADVARRLGLPLERARLLRFLVQHHMLFGDLVARRDPSALEAVEELARIAATEERLDALYLLAVADAGAVSPSAFPRWKDALYTDLWRRVRDVLAGRAEPALNAARHREETVRLLAAPFAAADYDAHVALAPRRYLLEVEPYEVALHIALASRLAAGEDPALARGREGALLRLWVATRDWRGLFAALAGAVTASRASILGAEAYTRSDGVVLDRLTLAFPEGHEQDEELWAALERTVRQAVKGERRVPDLLRQGALAAALERAPDRPSGRLGARAPATVTCSNRLSDRYTVVDVTAEDRVGLLCELCVRLAELDVDIHGAKVGTRGRRAVDIFYVTRGGAKIDGQDALDAIARALAEAADGAP